MATSIDARRLDLLRDRRTRRPRDPALAALFASEARELERRRKRLAGVGAAWEAACPSALLDRTAIDGVSRGVLTIRAADAATKFELDRFLRAGGERIVVGLAPTTIRRVRLSLGSI